MVILQWNDFVPLCCTIGRNFLNVHLLYTATETETCLSSEDDELREETFDPSVSGSGVAPERPHQLVEYMSTLDHDEMERIRDYNPAIMGNKHQVFGYLREKDAPIAVLEQQRLAVLARMKRGRSSLDSFYDSEVATFVGKRELMRSFEGRERDSVNRTEQVQYQFTQPVKRSSIDRFLGRIGARGR